MRLIAITTLVGGAAFGADLPDGWRAVAGDDWTTRVDIGPLLYHPAGPGLATAVCEAATGAAGAFRCRVEPGLGVKQCGILFCATRDLEDGLWLTLGGNLPVGGLVLKSVAGEVLWEDSWAPWTPYGAYVLEGIAEHGRVRVQLLAHDRRTLISQSDWIEAPAQATDRAGYLGVFAEGGSARFAQPEHTDEPLAAITDDAPNKRRLVSSADSPWRTFGDGNWMWTDKTHARIRQYASADRAWAVDTGVRGGQRTWRSAVRVSPGAGGAGIVVLAGDDATGGILCWLGGTHGAGCLMLYQNLGPGRLGSALWAGEEDKWHYDEDLVIETETTERQVRSRLIAADGAVCTESPWVDLPAEDVAREGCMAFHTWLGSAGFWGFEGDAAIASAAAPAAAAGDWITIGPGAWPHVEADEPGAVESVTDARSMLINPRVSGARGMWRGDVVPATPDHAVGLLFQVSPSADRGFACILGADGAALFDLARPENPLWRDPAVRAEAGLRYTLEGNVYTDRIVVRVLRGAEPLAASPTVYVPQDNNDRIAHIGFLADGPAVFSNASFAPGG